MKRVPPKSTLADKLFPYTTLVRAGVGVHRPTAPQTVAVGAGRGATRLSARRSAGDSGVGQRTAATPPRLEHDRGARRLGAAHRFAGGADRRDRKSTRLNSSH